MKGALDRLERVLRDRLKGEVRRDVPAARLTTLGVGGRVGLLVEAASEDDLLAFSVAVRESEVPWFPLGAGSNLLVSDEGFSGVLLRLGSGLRSLEVRGEEVQTGAAVKMPVLAEVTAEKGLSGLEFATGIPGTVGGAVAMNAGAHGQDMGKVLEEVRVFLVPQGQSVTLRQEELALGYRSSGLPAGSVVTSARFRLSPCRPEEALGRIEAYRAWRREHQPISSPNCGSVFINPEGVAAGELLDRLGVKGMAVGGARVSEVHANFIVVSPGATATDVYRLIRALMRLAEERAGVKLEPEVRLLGNFPEVEE